MIKMKQALRKILQKPVAQFMAIGVLLFIVNTYLIEQGKSDEENFEVHLTSGEVKAIEEVWESKWMRPPTPIELEGMIKQRVEETILFREAKKNGLDKNDAIIRQRLSQKLEFLSNDLIKPDSATAEEVEFYYKTNIAKYTSPERVTVYQLFINPSSYEVSSLENEATRRLSKLNGLNLSSLEIDNYGDQFTLQSYFPNKTSMELAESFGSDFASTIFNGDLDLWYGPVSSQYGSHLVYVSNKTPKKEQELGLIYDLVAQDLQIEQQAAINKLYIDGILSRYEVINEDKME